MDWISMGMLAVAIAASWSLGVWLGCLFMMESCAEQVKTVRAEGDRLVTFWKGECAVAREQLSGLRMSIAEAAIAGRPLVSPQVARLYKSCQKTPGTVFLDAVFDVAARRMN